METPDLLVEIAARHAVHLEGVKTSYAKAFDKFLRSMRADVLAQLAQVDDMESLRGRKLSALLKAVRKTLETGMGDYREVWLEQLKEVGEYEAGFELRALGQVVNHDFILPSPEQIITAAFNKPLSVKGPDEGQLLASMFDNWSDKTYRRVEGAIRLSAAQGEGLNQTIRRLKGTRAAKYRDGILDASRRDMALIARTSVQHIATQAREAVWDANADIIEQVEFVAVLDGRTSAICRGLSGKKFDLGKGPRPPLHMACRSLVVPVLRGSLALLQGGGEQISRGAKGLKLVDADMDYYDWLKTQPASFQDSVLGDTRGKLLRDGGLSATRFRDLQLDKKFRERTIDELRKLEPVAFERAGI